MTEQRWVLHVPFITAPAFTLKEERSGEFAGRSARAFAAPFGYTNLVIGDLSSPDAARELFATVRTGLLAASLIVSLGIRVQREATLVEPGEMIPGGDPGLPLIYADGQGLAGIFVHNRVTGIQVDKAWPKLVEGLEFGSESEKAAIALADDRVRRAFEVYEDSYFEQSDSAQLMGLVGVLEILKDKAPVSESAQQLLRDCQEQLESLDAGEAQSLRGSLDRLKEISISRGIKSVTERHLSADRAREAAELYQVRSSLVHDGVQPENFFQVLLNARQLVMELLASILVKGER